MKWLAKNPDLLFVAALLMVLLIIFVPLPAPVMDACLVTSLSIAVVTMLTVTYVRDPLEFSVFPTILLLSTAFRLGLNIATTRLILTHAAEQGTGAAGKVVEAFGLFVAGNEPLVGGVIFMLITLVNFMVITRGGNRVSEVAARFTLDAMPGKQMAIDAEMNAGSIDEAEARRRRERVWSEATFYGSMDGAMKFIRGDAVAGIVITFVNILGGLLMGALKYGMSISEALSTFTILTVGDGLVSQVPALMVSVAAGLMVTRASSPINLGQQFAGQMFAERRVMAVAGAFTLVIALFSMTHFSLLTVELMGAGGIFLALYYWLGKKKQPEAPVVAEPKVDEIEKLLKVEPMEVEVGVKLLRYIDPGMGGTLLDQVASLRREMAEQLGFLIPSIKIHDNLKLEGRKYQIKIRGVKVAEGTLAPNSVMVTDGAGDKWPTMQVIPGSDPVTGKKGLWVPVGMAENIQDPSATVRDCTSVLVDHLRYTIRSNAAELLTRDDTKRLVGALRESNPDLYNEGMDKLPMLHQVLQSLLSEGVSIRDLGLIIENLSEDSERVRRALARSICQSCLAQDGKMYGILLDPEIESVIRRSSGSGKTVQLSMEVFGQLTEAITRELARCPIPGYLPVILTSADVRAAVRRIAESINPAISVLAREEVCRDIQLESLGVVRVLEAATA
jgi:flagellar biosynthesis protein FlhA